MHTHVGDDIIRVRVFFEDPTAAVADVTDGFFAEALYVPVASGRSLLSWVDWFSGSTTLKFRM